ncbi:recombinase family protein [Nocardia higoensis]|uniref:recombinase family protein n=1 Tax=Nocardia higoensis TaxID=228599 RepID=UPI0002FBED1F|nr:recombinase family protein [Nocardia higoensis]
MSNEHVGKRVLGRIRLSREAQDTGTSAERQREAIEAWARMHSARIVGWAIDLGVSGGMDPFKTPEFGAWLKPERLHEWDVVVAYRLDRVSRRLIPLSGLLEFLKDNGKSLASTSESIDLGTWAGRLVATVLAIVAEGELEAATERNLGSQAKTRKLGRLHNASVPFGYRREKLSAGQTIWGNTVAETAGWYAVVDPEQAEILRTRMIAPLLAHRSANAIANDLNEAGIPSRFANRTRSGQAHSGVWDSTVVRRILGSPALLGYGLHKGEVITDDDGVPLQRSEPLVTKEEFDQIQAVLAAKSIRQTQRDLSTNLLSGVAFCYVCKGPLYRQPYKNRNVTYYRCPNSYHGKPKCEYKNMRAETLTALAEELFMYHVGDVERMDRVFIPASDHTEALERVEVALSTARRENELGLYEGSEDEYLDRVKRLVERKRELEKLPSEPARFEYRGLGETYGEAWQRMNTEQRRALLLDSGIRIEAVGPNKSPTVHMFVPEDIRQRFGDPRTPEQTRADHEASARKEREKYGIPDA